MTMMLYPNTPEAAKRLLTFLNASPTPFHAVHNASVRLESAGFRKLREAENWEPILKGGGKYYFVRNQAALIAFTLPQRWKQGAGLSIVATHVDSPNLRVRPVSKKSKAGYLQVGVETYGGGIWHSWLDRDLSLAGRVIVGNNASNFTSKLVKIDRPILRIPTLAIHLDRNVNESFKFNQESEFVPVLGLAAASLNKPAASNTDEGTKASSIQKNHHSELLALVAGELSVAPEEIHDFELALYDTQPSVLGGINNEFVFSPRLDNLYSSFCAVDALASLGETENALPLEGNVNVISLFNHEEIGSVSMSGAESNLIPSLLSRLSPTSETLAESIAKSFLVSCDMGHAIHPNYASKHEENHAPVINGGVIIKTNAKQRYTSDAVTTFLLKQLIEKKGGKVQEFEVRNDMACGSTVGPHLSTIGLRVVDIGMGMLSMHSIRETAGSDDVQSAIDLFTSLFEGFAPLDAQLSA
ncbi:peptidase M18, aminopeptidase I [Cylindrobasidium torrendii FP15055 ss-10]|uniref:aspartyl aminopeptidase n=1 Tax=Cylindrobasidium torrendii FP15055 ss-10 TaxID=1314674 RepID=A0A0D7BT95_9AGAR|nr:peptidase M18, aminopeptidase I [Cylindrobasidium torrendii FP15055 ss-10]